MDPPGREAPIDLTHASELEVTIAGAPLAHLLFEFVLCARGRRFVQVVSDVNYFCRQE